MPPGWFYGVLGAVSGESDAADAHFYECARESPAASMGNGAVESKIASVQISSFVNRSRLTLSPHSIWGVARTSNSSIFARLPPFRMRFAFRRRTPRPQMNLVLSSSKLSADWHLLSSWGKRLRQPCPAGFRLFQAPRSQHVAFEEMADQPVGVREIGVARLNLQRVVAKEGGQRQ